ncbi:MAG TPA: hypothetical protein VJH03_02070 [Blastocatellia bacterium]|nr:hypothetical protein [Blastocatellia bacterium]
MTHPFEAIPIPKQTAALMLLFVGAAVLTVALNRIGSPLRTAEAPQGIISFEFAGSAAAAARIIGSWDESARVHAAFSIGLDYLYLVAYSTTSALACVWASGILRRRGISLIGRAGVAIAWAQWLAALLDATENTALMSMLLGSPADALARIAWAAAAGKFALILAGVLYILLGGAVSVWYWIRYNRAG